MPLECGRDRAAAAVAKVFAPIKNCKSPTSGRKIITDARLADAPNYSSFIIASTDDPFGGLDKTQQRARAWKSGLIVLGALGHINASSGLGDWPQGRALLDAFSAGLSR